MSRRSALALGCTAAASAAVIGRPVSAATPDQDPHTRQTQPSYSETEHIRRFYECARF